MAGALLKARGKEVKVFLWRVLQENGGIFKENALLKFLDKRSAFF